MIEFIQLPSSSLLLNSVNILNFGDFLPQTDIAITVESLESILIGVISIALLVLSLSSYRKTGVKNIKYAAIAFGLFAFDVFVELIMEKYYYSNYLLQDLFHTSITLAILSLFFLSIVKKAY